MFARQPTKKAFKAALKGSFQPFYLEKCLKNIFAAWSRQFTNHQIFFAHTKIERSQLVLAGVSLYIGFVYINFYISSGRMPWLPAPPCTKSATLLMVDSRRR
ncbi:MAG: hypothetical protein ACYTXI_32795 [Nostoc sp.]